jgi:hypothetical protein
MILKAGRASDRRIQDARPRPRLIPRSGRKVISFSLEPLSARNELAIEPAGVTATGGVGDCRA